MIKLLRQSLSLLLLFTALLGCVYPAAVTAFAQLAFHSEANGSIILGDRPIGSALLGQPFSRPDHFWGRPSATSPGPYNAMASTGSNLGPTNPALRESVKARIEAYRSADPDNTLPVPVDLVTASGSGLDPHISPAAAYYQVLRVSRTRGLPEASVRRLIDELTENRFPGFLGEPRVNVLRLNLALERLKNEDGK
jgi:potassium-transporting ATPase KdpC subunit